MKGLIFIHWPFPRKAFHSLGLYSFRIASQRSWTNLAMVVTANLKEKKAFLIWTSKRSTPCTTVKAIPKPQAYLLAQLKSPSPILRWNPILAARTPISKWLLCGLMRPLCGLYAAFMQPLCAFSNLFFCSWSKILEFTFFMRIFLQNVSFAKFFLLILTYLES